MNTDFFSGLRVSVSRLDLVEPVEMKRTAGGAIVRASLGEALWHGTGQIVPSYHAEARQIGAVLAYLMRPGQTFLAGDSAYVGPRSDPWGLMLGTTVPVIEAISVDTRQIRLGGLPVGYVLQPGDRLSFTYGSSPLRYAFHEVVYDGGPADASGVSPWLTVNPNIRPGAVAGAAVQLIRPAFKAVLEAGSRPQFAALIASGASLSFVQTLR